MHKDIEERFWWVVGCAVLISMGWVLNGIITGAGLGLTIVRQTCPYGLGPQDLLAYVEIETQPRRKIFLGSNFHPASGLGGAYSDMFLLADEEVRPAIERAAEKAILDRIQFFPDLSCALEEGREIKIKFYIHGHTRGKWKDGKVSLAAQRKI